MTNIPAGELQNEFEHLNALVAGYDDSPFDRLMRHWMLRSLEPWLRPGKALEFGCLYGEFTRLLLERFTDITVVDAAKRFLEITKERVGNPVGRRITYEQALFETFETSERFESIFLMHILEHLIDPVAVLEKARSLLSERGRAFLVVPNGNAVSRQIAVKMGLLKQLCDFSPADVRGGHRRVYLLDTLQSDARAAGLKIVHSGGIFFKALANFQFDALAGGELISSQFMEACYELGKEHPTMCASIFLVCER